MACPADETILGFIEETLSAEAANAVKQHVDGCADCRTLLVHAARSFFVTPGSDGAPPKSQLGRYVIIDLIGAGGMGVVYRARDPLLNREVALKVLWRADGGGGRLLAEAEAMARLSHPNVVAVYDAGTFLDRIFLAMERVEGETLSDWLTRPRTLGEKLEVLVAAGRGLAAAHAAGLVHRDFKPQNVLVGADGRVRVTDFGLARAAGDARAEPPGDSSGTPAYMAPEQFRGGLVDARTDQFSFCVALYEALYGIRPYRGLTLDELRGAVLWGVVTPPPGSAIPRQVRQIVLRGLSVAPDDRYPSMDALLAALERRLRPRRRWPVAAALSLIALAGVTGYVEYQRARDRRCVGPPLAGAWDDARKQAVHEGLMKSGAPYAESTWTRAVPLLDRYAATFAAAQARACQAPPGVLAELRLSCLDDRRRQLGAVTELLSRADSTVMENAIESIDKLTPIEDCADVHALESQLLLPKDRRVRQGVAAFRRTLTDAEALERAGKYADGIALLSPKLENARALGYLPLEAETLYRLGSLHGEAGDYPEAEALLQRAASAAEASGHAQLTARAWIALVYFVGVKGARAENALEWNRFAEAAIERLGGSGAVPALAADRCFALGRLDRALGRANEALAQFDRAGALYKKTFGDEHELVAETLLGASSIYESEGRHKEAAEANERALAISEKTLGPEHPKLIPLLGHLGVLLVVEGRFDQARTTYLRALDIGQKTVGAEHVANAQIHSELGQLLGRLGHFDEGRAHLETALRLTERAVGGDHADVAAVLDNLGTLYLYAQKPEQALEYQRRALAIFEKSGGPDHPRVGRCLHHMSAAFIAEKKYAEALDCAERARAITEKAYGKDGRDLGVTLTLLAEAQLGLGNPRAAFDSATRGLELRQVRGASATSLADTRFVLARATFDAKHDRAAARALALSALDAYVAAEGPRAERDRARVQDWLDTHGF